MIGESKVVLFSRTPYFTTELSAPPGKMTRVGQSLDFTLFVATTCTPIQVQYLYYTFVSFVGVVGLLLFLSPVISLKSIEGGCPPVRGGRVELFR